jgi:hypothetical protein
MPSSDSRMNNMGLIDDTRAKSQTLAKIESKENLDLGAFCVDRHP